ncbi:MAG: ATP-binding protein [Gemmatimonadota bacterium]
MHGCPCGYQGHEIQRCTCTPTQVDRYVSRVSGPLLDRIDIHIRVPPLSAARLTADGAGETSAAVRDRVIAARDRQTLRFDGPAQNAVPANGDMGPRELKQHCRLDAAGERLIRTAVVRLGLSARAFHRVLRVARTIADLEGAVRIGTGHLAEAVQYRSLDRA